MTNDTSLQQLTADIKRYGEQLGFQQVGISDIDLNQAEENLKVWLARGFHADMEYMVKHGVKRTRPAELVPGTLRVITVRMDYLPPTPKFYQLANSALAYVSRYALGRDYHKLIRKRLEKLANFIEKKHGPFQYRAFADSAPVMEKPLAEKAGLGWIGKNTLLINKKAGSWFFLGSLYVNIPLITDAAAENHCGSCRKCIDICPTGAIVAPYQLDARRCISNLTIEYRGSIPVALRPLIGNRIFGCDDCQIVCPWNKFAKITAEIDFYPRHQLDDTTLVELFSWSETEFNSKTEGSAIRRIGYECWLRNIAIALGNAKPSLQIQQALVAKLEHPSILVREHVMWALNQFDR